MTKVGRAVQSVAWMMMLVLLTGCATTSACSTGPSAGGAVAYGAGTAAGIASGLFWPVGLIATGAELLWHGGAALACRAAQSPPESVKEPDSSETPPE